MYIPLHSRSTPTLRAYYRCDKVIKDNLEGEILWTGPSEKHVLVIETDPQDFLHDSFLVDTMKKQIFNSLKQQPYVQALLQAGDTLGMAKCEILYQNNVAFISGLSEMEDNLSFNEEIDIDENQELTAKYQVRGVPTLVMLDDDREVKRISGTLSTKQLQEWMNG